MKLTLIIFLFTVHIYGYAQQYVIRNVHVISMVNEGVVSKSDVLIDNGKIKSIGSNLKIPNNCVVIDGTDKFLIPGLYDMHAHFFYEQGNNVDTCEEELKLMLAKGITTARIACGDPLYLEKREKVSKGELIGPKLIVTSPQIVGYWPWSGKVFAGIATTPAEGDSLVRLYKAQGYDQIKITFMVKPDVYDAIQNTARDTRIKVVGHVGPLVKLPKALRVGQQIEHMDEFIDMLLPDTSYNHGQSVSDMNLWRKAAWETVPVLDESKIPDLVKKVKASGIYVTPTNFFFYSFFGKGISEKDIEDNIGFQYVPAILRIEAREVLEAYQKRSIPIAWRNRYISIRSKIIKELWLAGVPLMAGSDSPQWFSISGFAIHDELENLVKVAGISPYAALQAATINPAKFMGFENKNGTITIGKEADLILLDKNPLDDISNTRSIAGIMNNGKWYDEKALTAMLEEVKRLAD